MTEEEWDTIAMMLDKGFQWREPFGDAHLTTYRLLLDGYDEAQIVGAIRMLAARGQKWGPKPGEIIEMILHDPSKPTFVEAYRLIYGHRGILRARPIEMSWADPIDRFRAYDQAAQRRAAEMHPLVSSFVARYGIDRLRNLEVDHPDYGDLKRRELEAAWDRHVEAMEGRELAAIGRPRRADGLRQLDPLAALDGRPPQQLPENTTTEGARP